MARLVKTPDSDNQLIRSELRAWVLRGLELGTADVAYCSNVVSGILVCERIAFRGRGFGRRLQGGWDVHFQCYQAKVSIFQDLLLNL